MIYGHTAVPIKHRVVSVRLQSVR